MKQEFLGDKKIITVKLQTLRREFEAMKDKEFVQEFLPRVSTIVSQMKTYTEDVSNQTVVSKVLRSLTANFDYIVAAIEESKDLSTYTFDELMSSLQAHEARVSRSSEKVEEKAFQAKGETSEYSCRGRGRGRGKGQGRGRGKAEVVFTKRGRIKTFNAIIAKNQVTKKHIVSKSKRMRPTKLVL